MTLPRFSAFLLAAWLPAYALTSAASVQEANQAFRQGRHAVALEKVNAFLAGSPKDAQGRFLKGLVLTELNRNTEAIKVFNDLTDDFPELPEPYNNLAVLYAAQGNYDRAKSSLEMAIRTHPSYATAHENLGDIYAKMASQAYDKALQLDNTNVSAQTKLAMIRDLFSPAPRPQDNAKAKAKPTPKPATKPSVAPAETPAQPDPGAAKSAEAQTPPEKAAGAAKPETPAPAKPTEPTKTSPEMAKPVAPITQTAPEAAKQTAAATDIAKPSVAIPPPETKAAEPAAKPAEPAKAVAKPAGKRPKDPAASVEYDVHAWAAAWSAQDVSAYLSHYGSGFKPPKGKKRDVWEAERRERIARAQSIKVVISDLKVSVKGGSVAKAKFRQRYTSNLLDNSSNKTLVLRKQGDAWKIAEEY